MSIPPRRSVSVLVAALVLGAAGQAVAATVNVSTSGLSFTPDSVTIHLGDTVHWTDLQAGFHNVAQTDGPADNVYNGTGFRSGPAGTVDTYDVTFTTTGTYYYVCEPHAFSDMKGEITVLPAGAPAANDWARWLTAASLIGVGAAVVWRRIQPVSAR